MYVDAATTHFGFVVDYSGTTPVVHLIAKHNGVVGVQCTVDMTSVTTPLYMLYSGPRAEVGYQARFNSGADTTNHPFFYTLTQLQNLLNGIGETTAASSLVLGFGKTRALAQDTAPSLTVPANTSVSLGSPLTLMATATDAEEGALTDKIEWLDQASLHYAPVVGFGGTFKLTPSALGKHDVLVSVTDKLGVTTRQIVTVTVTGTLPQAGTVQLVKDGLSGQGAFVASDGVSAYFTSVPHHFKDGLRANQGVYGQFWYFEAHRNVSSKGFGIGLVVGDGSLDPYEFVKVPWSMSINTSASVWHNLISVGNYDTSFADYGFAVDYRGDSPIVYVIVNGQLAKKLAMPEVTVPLYPMAYGGRTDFGSAGAPAVTFDFSPPFQFDPATILGADGVGVELGWGDVNTP
jgi:hypothetical protein